MNDGIPYGLVVTDGVLRSSGNINSVGFFDNGAAIIGKPGLTVKLVTASGTTADLFYNKALSLSNGIGLYSNDYDYKTKNTVSAYNLVLQPTSQQTAQLTMNGAVTARVTQIVEKTASCDVPAGCFVLSVADNSIYTSALTTMKSIAVGDSVTIQTASDPAWQNVLYACGGGDMLVENGTADSVFTLETAKKSVARTAIGLRQDGSLVLYTADYGSASTGLTLAELAERMTQLGCVTALNLDGGGSTAMGAQYPGYSNGATVNQPSDGSLRKCANFIFLVRKTTAAAAAANLYVYPYHAAMRYQAILFDMDGVLIESEAFMAKTGVRALADFGITAKPEDFAEFVGQGEDRYVGGVAEKYGHDTGGAGNRARHHAAGRQQMGERPGLPGRVAAAEAGGALFHQSRRALRA